MFELSVSIDIIFTERPWLERIAAVAQAGFSTFEFWGWRDKDLDATVEAQKRLGLKVGAFNIDSQAEILNADSHPMYIHDLRTAIGVAKKLGCPRIMSHVQQVPWGAGQQWYGYMCTPHGLALREQQRDNVVKAMKMAAAIAEGEGLTLLMEPLNTMVDHAGYFLASSDEGFQFVRRVQSPAVRLLFDIYHQQITEGNLINNLTQNVDLLGYVHLGDVPGRHEPGTGEINFANVLRAIQGAGYKGVVGLEYIPSGDPFAALASTKALVEQAAS
jgi:hydroxypyruvate isomerase